MHDITTDAFSLVVCALIHLLVGLVWFAFLIANKLDSETKSDAYEDSMADLGSCLIFSELGLGPPDYPGLACGDIPALRPNYALTIGLVIVVSGIGLFAIVVNG